MNAIGIIGIIIAVGLVSMIEICAIVICVNKMIDQKMKTKVDLELKVFKEEMGYLGNLLDSVLNKINFTTTNTKNTEQRDI